jgi:hypothetical protein
VALEGDQPAIENGLPSDASSSRTWSRAAWLDTSERYVLVLALCFSIWTKLHWGPQTLDDAYITLRYVANLLAGCGFVYNAGEYVLGTTSPFYTLLLWTIAAITGERDLPFLAFATNLVIDVLNVFLVRSLALELGASRLAATLVALAHALSASFVYYGSGGMETVVFVLWLLAAFNAYLRGWLGLAFTFAGLATITRPEGFLLLVVFGVVDATIRRRIPWEALAGVFPLACWTAFAWWYFGSPVPHSVLAKISPIYDPQPPLAIFWMLARHLLRVVASTLLPAGAARPLEPVLGLGVLVPATAVVLVSASSARVWALPSFLALFWAGYGIANRILAEWYPVPLEPLYVTLLLVASAVACQTLCARMRLGPNGGVVAVLVMAALVVPARLRDFKVGPSPYFSHAWFRPVGFWPLDGRESVYREAAAVLEPAIAPQTVVALSEIGAFGYFSRARILDTAGLVSPVALGYYPLAPKLKATNNAVPPDLIRDLAPDYVASLEIFIRASLLDADWFREKYELAFRLPTRCFGSRDFLVFRRKALLASSLSGGR